MPPKLANVPGVNDVAKQIWYKQSLEVEAQARGFSKIHNVFLFPADIRDITLISRVELPAGGERVDAVSIPFAEALAVYSGDRAHAASVWRRNLAAELDRRQ